MKKLSISLFALMAIIFAVASAFTTVSKKSTLTPDYKIISVPAQTISSSSPNFSALSTYLDRELDDLNATPQAIESWYSGQSSVVCLEDAEYVCIAEMEVVGQTVYDFKAGAFDE